MKRGGGAGDGAGAEGGDAASPPTPLAHHHGALVGIAEGLERALLQPPAAGSKEAVAVAHDELAAERLTDPFRRTIAAAP